MKKLIYVTLRISIVFQAFIGFLFESQHEANELENNEKLYCTSFTIPDDKDILEPKKLFSVLMQTAKETDSNLFRTYLKGNDDNSKVEVVKYILLTGESKYNKTFTITSGRSLVPQETGSLNCNHFISTKSTGSKEQTGKLFGHMFCEDVSIHPFYQMFSELSTSGHYLVELPPQIDKKFFLQILQKNLRKEFNKQIPIKSLEGEPLHTFIPFIDVSFYQGVFCIIMLLLAAFLLYALFSESKQIAVLKLNGISTGKILWLLLRNIFIFFACSLILVAIAIGIYTKEWFYVWLVLRNSIGMYIFILILLIVIGILNIRTCSVHQNLNGKSNSRNVFCLNMAVKALSILLILLVGQMVYTNFKDYQKNINLYKAWGDASSYGIFSSRQVGSSITMSDMLQEKGRIGKYVYPVLNKQGSLIIDASDFQPKSLREREKNPSAHFSSVKVNPNYLNKYLLLDNKGNQVSISENETDWVLLIPEHYKNKENELKKSFNESREGMNEVDREVYGTSVEESKGVNIKIIWIEDGQDIYTFNSKVSPETAGAVSNVIVEVMTEQNSGIADRDCVNGNGDSDPLKVKLHGTKQETYDKLLPTLKKARVAESLTCFVSLDQNMMQKATKAKGNMNFNLVLTLVIAAVLVLTVVQNMVIVFNGNKKDIIVKKLFEWKCSSRFGKYVLITISVSIIMMCAYWAFSIVTGRVKLEYLVISSLVLLLVETVVSLIAILHTENRKIVDTLKGE